MTIGLRVLVTALAVLTAWPSAGSAQTKLKWAHVYEVAEPYHTEALWAGEEIKKRTNGKYQIDVFPASQLGNENQINEGLGLGTVDMITGSSIATPSCFATSPRATRTRPSTRSSRSPTTASAW
jgi:TRAP-type C4-dicarboxylate transport system substrate-binding protein